MQAVIGAIVAAFVGIILGFWLRGASGRAEKAQSQQRLQELINELATARADLGKAHTDAAARAGFESLATERERMIAQLNADRDKALAQFAADRDRTIAQLHAEREALQTDLQAKNAIELRSAARIRELEADLRNERQNLTEKVALLEGARKTLADQFEALAGKILDEKSKSFSDANKTEIGHLLTPLREQITEFRAKVEQAQTDSKTGVAELRGLIGNLDSLNKALAQEAHNLTTALRGSAKAQGDWGEFILRDLLDKAGLREGEQYTFQQSFTGVEGEDGGRARTVRTDVILNLPGGRHLVVDSKVSLTAYTDCTSATEDEPRRAALKLHLASVRGHIAGLAKAGYHRLSGVEGPDFVVMFVPIEPAFLLALQNDADLWSEAYKQGILLVGPTTLLYVIRIINLLWQQQQQSRNVQDVMKRGGDLYDKFVNFVTDMEAVGKSLRGAEASWSGAMSKLSEGRGNLIRQVEMLRKLNVSSTKQLPPNLLETARVDAADTDEPLLAFAAQVEESVEAE